MRDIPRYVIRATGEDEEAEKLTLKKAIEILLELDDATKLTFITHTYDNDGYLIRLFGESLVKKLRQGTRLDDRFPAKYETTSTYRRKDGEVLVCLGLKDEDVMKLEDNSHAEAIVALTWLEDDLDSWISLGQVVDVLSDEQGGQELDMDPVVALALRTMSVARNIENKYDEKQAKTHLRALHSEGFSLDEDEIRQYLMDELQWSNKATNEVLEIVRKLNDGRVFRGGAKSGHKKLVEGWRERLDESS